MKTITNSSWKGGVGKTALTVCSMATLADKGFKILAIDLDSNLSLSRTFNFVGKSKTSIDLLNGEIVEPYKVTENIDIIPSDLRISRMSNLAERTLKNSLKKMDLSKYDYVFIDPPGTMNALTRNCLVAADKIIVPGAPSSVDYEAVGLVFNEMEEMGIEADVSVVINDSDTKTNENGILEKYYLNYGDFAYNRKISKMKSVKMLVGDYFNYKLQGRAKVMIERFVLEVVE